MRQSSKPISHRRQVVVCCICILILIIIIRIIIGLSSDSPEKKNEKYYVQLFSEYIKSSKIEYRLQDNSRVDIITSTHAIEVDFAIKWYGSIGQSLYYSLQTGLCPGIVLIIENNRLLNKLLTVAKQYNITVWSISQENERIKLWIN